MPDAAFVGTIVVWGLAALGVIAIFGVFVGWISERDTRKRSEDDEARARRQLQTEWDAIETINRTLLRVPEADRGDWWLALEKSLDAEIDAWNQRRRDEHWKRLVH